MPLWVLGQNRLFAAVTLSGDSNRLWKSFVNMLVASPIGQAEGRGLAAQPPQGQLRTCKPTGLPRFRSKPCPVWAPSARTLKRLPSKAARRARALEGIKVCSVPKAACVPLHVETGDARDIRVRENILRDSRRVFAGDGAQDQSRRFDDPVGLQKKRTGGHRGRRAWLVRVSWAAG